MIIGYTKDPVLRAALLQAARLEEDVVLSPPRVEEALAFGYPRLVVRESDEGLGLPVTDRGVPLLSLSRETLARWEEERRAAQTPTTRVAWAVQNLRGLVEQESGPPTWVDRTLGELGRLTGKPLPPGLKGFGRRVMEFPSHYDDLHPLAEACGTTRGALKARFRRRDLPSPSLYLRWFRIMAVAYTLSDRGLTVAQVASRLGYTSDGNLCRTMMSLTRLTPTETRTLHGWNRLVISFAWNFLNATHLEAWRDLDDLFQRRAA